MMGKTQKKETTKNLKIFQVSKPLNSYVFPTFSVFIKQLVCGLQSATDLLCLLFGKFMSIFFNFLILKITGMFQEPSFFKFLFLFLLFFSEIRTVYLLFLEENELKFLFLFMFYIF